MRYDENWSVVCIVWRYFSIVVRCCVARGFSSLFFGLRSKIALLQARE